MNPFFSCEISHYCKKKLFSQNSLFFEKKIVKKIVILGQCNQIFILGYCQQLGYKRVFILVSRKRLSFTTNHSWDDCQGREADHNTFKVRFLVVFVGGPNCLWSPKIKWSPPLCAFIKLKISRNELEMKKLWPPKVGEAGHFYRKFLIKQFIAYF